MKDRDRLPFDKRSVADKETDMKLLWNELCLKHEKASSPNWYDQIFQDKENKSEISEDILSKIKNQRLNQKNKIQDN